jgi:hypothetical protein
MTTGPDTTPAPQPPATGPVPGATAWTPGPPLPETRVRKPRPKALRVVVPVVVAVGVGVLRFTGVLGGADDPSVGDCVHETGSSGTSFDVVDCSSKNAQYKVVGIEPRKMTSKDFKSDDSLCSSVPETTYLMWSGTDPDEGTVYCAAPVGSAG